MSITIAIIIIAAYVDTCIRMRARHVYMRMHVFIMRSVTYIITILFRCNFRYFVNNTANLSRIDFRNAIRSFRARPSRGQTVRYSCILSIHKYSIYTYILYIYIYKKVYIYT